MAQVADLKTCSTICVSLGCTTVAVHCVTVRAGYVLMIDQESDQGMPLVLFSGSVGLGIVLKSL